MGGELTAATPSKTDLIHEITYSPRFIPRRSPKVNIKLVTIEGKTRYFMKNHENGSLYDLSELARAKGIGKI